MTAAGGGFAGAALSNGVMDAGGGLAAAALAKGTIEVTDFGGALATGFPTAFADRGELALGISFTGF